MSIKIMSQVWESGPEKQGEMVVLLVLADYANDAGECWPGVKSIAKKSRIEDRSARRILRKLEQDGWIECKQQYGRNHTNLYQINIKALKPDNMSAPTENRTIDAENRTIDAENRTQVSPEPSRTTKEPIEEPKGSLSSGDDLAGAKPLDEITEAVDAYRQKAAQQGWPDIRILSKSRRAALAARLREADGLEGWRIALEKAAASPLCNGNNERGWVANFDFLTRQSSFAKLMEGNYDDRPHNPQRQPNARSAGQGNSIAAIAARRRAEGKV